MYFAFSWSIRELYARVLYKVIWGTMRGRSENCISPGHMHKGRDWHFCLRSVPREAEYSTQIWRLRLSLTWVFWNAFLPAQSVQGHFNSWHVPAVYCHSSVLLPIPYPSGFLSFSIPRFWVPAVSGSEQTLLGKASSFSNVCQESGFCSFLCSLLTSLINGNLFHRMHFSFFFPILSKLFYLYFSSIQHIRKNPESILT